MITTLLNGPSPLLLYTPTFTSNGVRGGKVSSLYLYVVESAEVTIFSFQPLVPLARNATIYPKPSPFWNSSDTGWKYQKERNNQKSEKRKVFFTEIKCKPGLPGLQLCDWRCIFANHSHLNSFFSASKALIEQNITFSSMVVQYNQLSIYYPFTGTICQCK